MNTYLYMAMGIILIISIGLAYYTSRHYRKQRNKRYSMLKMKKYGGVPLTDKERAFVDGYHYIPVKQFKNLKWNHLKTRPSEVWDVVMKTINPFTKFKIELNKLQIRVNGVSHTAESTRSLVWKLEDKISKLEKQAKEKNKPKKKEPVKVPKPKTKEEELKSISAFDNVKPDIEEDMSWRSMEL